MRRPRPVSTALAALATLAASAVGAGVLPGPTGVAGASAAAAPTPSGSAPSRTGVPDGVAVLTVQGFVGTDGLWHYQLWATGSAGRRAVTTDPWLDPQGADLSPDGRRVAYTVGNGSHRPANGLYVTAIDGSATRNVLAGHAGLTAVRDPAWAPDGRRLAFVALDQGTSWDIWTVRADGSGLRRVTRCGCAWENTPRWSPTRNELLWSPGTYDVAVLDVASGSSTQIYDHTPSGAMNIQSYGWSPDGETVVLSGARWNEAGLGLHTVPRGGGPATALLARNDMAFDTPHWTPDGRYLVTTGWRPDTSPGGSQSYSGDAVVVDLERAARGEPEPWTVLAGPLRDQVVGIGADCGGCAPGGRWSQVTVRAETLSDGVWVTGGLLPGLTGQRVTVTIQRQRQRRWVTFARRDGITSAEAIFALTTPRRAGHICRVTVAWAGDSAHGPARARSRPFGC